MEKVLAMLGIVLEKASEEVGSGFLPIPDTLVLDTWQVNYRYLFFALFIPSQQTLKKCSTCLLTNCLLQVEAKVTLAMMASFCCLLNEN